MNRFWSTGIFSGVIIYVIYYFNGVRLIPGGIGERFQRGSLDVDLIPALIFWLALWALIMVVVRIRRVRQELVLMSELYLVLKEIEFDTSGTFIDNAGNLVNVEHLFNNSFLHKRISLIKQTFHNLDRLEHTTTLMSAQASIDGSLIEGSYIPVKTLIWALPVLGFVGTALGMAQAVGGFAIALDNAGNFEQLKRQLIENIVPHLSRAFDNTMLALCLSVITYFALSLLQKQEQEMFGAADAMSLEILAHIPDSTGSKAISQHIILLQQLQTVLNKNLESLATSDQLSSTLSQLRDALTALTNELKRPISISVERN